MGIKRDKRRWDPDDIFNLRQPSHRGQTQSQWQRHRKDSVMHRKWFPNLSSCPTRPSSSSETVDKQNSWDSTEYPSTMKERIRMEKVNGREAEMMYSERMTYNRHARLSTRGRGRSEATVPRIEQSETYRLDRNEHDIVKKLADQAATLWKLKWICIILAVLFVLNSVAFGLITNIMMRKTNTLEHTSDTLQTDIKQLPFLTSWAEQLGNITRLEDIEARLLSIESWNSNKSVADTKLFAWANEIEQEITSLQEQSIRLITVETEVEKTRTLLHKVSATVDEFNASLTSLFVTVEESVEKEAVINREHSVTLSQLESDTTSLTEKIEDHSFRITQLESAKTTDQSSIQLIMTEVTQMQTNLTSEIERIYSESILAHNKSIMELVKRIDRESNTSRIHSSVLTKLELDVSSITQLQLDLELINNAATERNETIVILEQNVKAQNVTLNKYISRLQEMETRTFSEEILILNNTVRISDLEVSRQSISSEVQIQASIIEALEIEANITQVTLSDLSLKLAQIQKSNITKLEQNLEMVNKVIGYQNVTIITLQDNMNMQNNTGFKIISKLEETEAKLMSEERLISNVTSRTSDLEVSLQTIYSDIQSQSFRIQTLEMETYTTQGVLSDQSSRLAEIQNSSITKLDQELESVNKVIFQQNETIVALHESMNTQNITLYEYRTRLEEVESKLISEEQLTFNNTLSILNLELSQHLQSYRIQALEISVNTTEKTLSDHSTKLLQIQNSSIAELEQDLESINEFIRHQIETLITLQDNLILQNNTMYEVITELDETANKLMSEERLISNITIRTSDMEESQQILYSEVQTHASRIEALEIEANTTEITLLDHSLKLAQIQNSNITKLEQDLESVNKVIGYQNVTILTLQDNMNMQNNTVFEIISKLEEIETKSMLEEILIQNITIRTSDLEVSRQTIYSDIQSQSFRIQTLEMVTNTTQGVLSDHSSRLAEIQNSSIIKLDQELESVNKVIIQQNETIVAMHESMNTQNITLYEYRTSLEEVESKLFSEEQLTFNNTLSILNLELSRQTVNSEIQLQSYRIQALEIAVNTTEKTLSDHSTKLLQIQNSSISELEQYLESVNEVIRHQNKTLITLQDNSILQNNTVYEIITDLDETANKLILVEGMISNVTIRTSDMEESQQTLNSEVQTHTSRIEALEIVANTTQATLSDYSLKLAQMQNLNITKLEQDLESVYEVVGKQNETILILQEKIDLQNDTLYEYGASVQEVESKLISNELLTLNNTLLIQDLETDQQTLSSKFQLQVSRIQSLETEMNTTKEMLLDHTTKLDRLQNSSFANINLDQAQDSRIQSLALDANITQQTLQDLSTRLSATDYQSAFTAYTPKAGSVSNTIKFIDVRTNIGGHYNTATGDFTCQYPGIYVFSLHICKDGNEPWAWCNIRLNGVIQAIAKTDVGDNFKPPQLMASTTVVLHLTNNDVVDLGDCSGYGSMDQDIRSSFSGYLLQAD